MVNVPASKAKTLYLYHKSCYIGEIEVYAPFELKFSRKNDKLDNAAELLMYWTDNFTDPSILVDWLYERIIPREREDFGEKLAMAHCPNGTDWEILLFNNAISGQDCFWISNIKDSSWYEKHHPEPKLEAYCEEYKRKHRTKHGGK